MLEIDSLNAGYGKLHILFDITTKIRDKEMTVLVGPNGSGKSTLLKTIMGITQVYSGKIVFNGSNIVGIPPHTVTKLGIAYLPQLGNVFVNLKVRENLLMASYLMDKYEAKERSKEVLDIFPNLKSYMDKKAGMLSGGERQMLAMAMALMRRPQVMLFDEPTASLSPKIAYEVLDKIVKLRDEYGITLVVAEQNARRALEHGDRAILLVSGKVMYDGSSESLLKHPELGQVYLGVRIA